MSETERPELLDPSHEVTCEDIRALTGAATPHFALQIRNRRKLIQRILVLFDQIVKSDKTGTRYMS